MIWENVHTVNVSDGLFSVILIDLPVTIRHTVEMEIQVGDEILSPRHSFTSVPFSFSSHFSLFAGIANEADTSVVSHHAQFSVQAEHSDSSNFAQNSGHSIYSASKAGLIGLTKSLGKELADKNISVNCVTPAAAKTKIFDQISQEHIDYMLSKIPRNRFVLVEELASLVAWMSSEENSYTTGSTFDLSGGRATY